MRYTLLAWIPAGLFLLSGCNETSAPPAAGIEEPLAELSSAVTRVQSDYVAPNQALFKSLDGLLPYVDAILSATPSWIPNRLSPSLLGRTYGFDGAAYQVTGAPGAPSDGVRFLLYDLTAAGTPLVDHPRGHVEIRSAPGAMPVFMTLRVVRDSISVVRLDVAGESLTHLEWKGDLATPAGTSTVSWGGDILGDQNTFQAQLPRDVRILYSVLGEGATPENVLVQALRGTETPDWELYADIVAETDGNIMEGPVRVATRDGSHLAACMTGTLEMPVFESAVAGDCVYFGLTAIDVSSSDLNALEGSYLVLRNLYLVSRRLLKTGLAGLAPSS